MKATNYIIKLLINTGSIEKTSIHLVKSTCRDEAKAQALLSECVCELGDGAEFNGANEISDNDGEMTYQVCSIKPVSYYEFKILEKHIY